MKLNKIQQQNLSNSATTLSKLKTISHAVLHAFLFLLNSETILFYYNKEYYSSCETANEVNFGKLL